jgi:hypothetical protein
MTKKEIKEIIKSGISPVKICRVFMSYDANYRYYLPLKVSDKPFLGAAEDDFILNGYCVRRFRDVNKAEIKDDKCLEILHKEGIIESLTCPDVDVTDFYTVFSSLQKIGKNIIVEKGSLDEELWEYTIGKIEKVCKNKVYMRGFDADGIWDEENTEILFSNITSVTFGSRYDEIFSKYVLEFK